MHAERPPFEVDSEPWLAEIGVPKALAGSDLPSLPASLRSYGAMIRKPVGTLGPNLPNTPTPLVVPT